MSAFPFLGTDKMRLCLIVIAAFAAVATATFATEDAGAASSGGVGTPGSANSADDPAPSAQDSARYDRVWKQFSARDRRWANKTSECESGRNPRAVGGGGLYRGAFQFMKATWKASPKSPGGDPVAYSYRTQGVVAILLMKRDGAGHWPVCG